MTNLAKSLNLECKQISKWFTKRRFELKVERRKNLKNQKEKSDKTIAEHNPKSFTSRLFTRSFVSEPLTTMEYYQTNPEIGKFNFLF